MALIFAFLLQFSTEQSAAAGRVLLATRWGAISCSMRNATGREFPI